MIKQIVSLALALFLSVVPFGGLKPVDDTPNVPEVQLMSLLPDDWGH